MVNTKGYLQQLTDLNRSLLEKCPEYRKRKHKVIFLCDNASMTHNKTDAQHVRSTQLGVRLTHQTWLLPILPLLCVDESRTCWTALRFVRRCEKMARWMVRSKRGRFLLAWYSQIARKMRKMYNKRWSVLWIRRFW